MTSKIGRGKETNKSEVVYRIDPIIRDNTFTQTKYFNTIVISNNLTVGDTIKTGGLIAERIVVGGEILYGHTGKRGERGQTGQNGNTGPTGPSGTMGSTGSTGSTGQKGDTGNIGPTGPAGGSNGGIGLTGTNYGNYIYWDTNANSFVVGDDKVSIGSNAGRTGQSSGSIAIGVSSGLNLQQGQNIAIGMYAGRTQYSGAIAIGGQAAIAGIQGTSAIAIGYGAGYANQSNNAIALGLSSGSNTQGAYSIAIGSEAGLSSQGSQCIAIGNRAGYTNQGSNCIAIGYQAGYDNQHNNTIILNATSGTINSSTNNATYILPIRDASASSYILLYDVITGEVCKSTATSSTSKTFVIDHPIDKNKYLVHACLEGPEAGVYYRGQGKIDNKNDSITIDLPDYVNKFTTELTAHVTIIGNPNGNLLGVSEILNNKFTVYGKPCKFNWIVYGKRENIEVEPNKKDVILNGSGPYKWI
jgi:hypothetical protein